MPLSLPFQHLKSLNSVCGGEPINAFYNLKFQIRLQLETLLAEKARLAHENSVYARENRFLREIVEYHQLTMQDIVYLDEGIEEVTEVYPIPAVSRMLSTSPPAPASPCTPSEVPLSRSSSVTALASIAPQVAADHEAPPTSTGEDLRSQ